MKKAAFFAASFLLANTVLAGSGPIFMCHTDDYRVIARVKPQIGEALVEKLESGMPSYLFTGCDYNPSAYRMYFCSEPGGRVFVMNSDMTGRYVGSGRTADLECVLSTSHGE